MSAGLLVRRAGAPQVIDWGWVPRGNAPADTGGRTPQVAMALARLACGVVIDWGRLPRGALAADVVTSGTRRQRSIKALIRRKPRRC